MWVWVIACHKAEPPSAPAPVAPAPAAPTTPEADLDAMFKALSAYDGEPACADVEALTPQPVPALLELVRTVQMPPTVPMRAAGCLVDRHAVEVADALEAWVGSADTLGLARLVADKIDAVPPEVAVRVAAAAAAGPNAADLGPRLARSARPEVRAAAGH
jgi:hypothetical protein